MGTDDDNTPPGRPRRRPRAQTSTERDLEGLTARAARHAAAEASLESERTRMHRERKERRTHPQGVPVQPHPDMVERELSGTVDLPEFESREITEPWEILDRDLQPDEEQIVKRSKRDSNDPLTVADGAKFLRRLIHKELDDRSAQKQRADEYMAILDTTPSGKLAARVSALESQAVADKRRSSNWQWALRGIVLLCAGGLLTFVDRIWDRSAHETEMAFRLQAAEKTIERQDATIERLERRINTLTAPTWTPQQHSNKDPQP